MTQVAVTTYGYGCAVMNGALLPDTVAMRDTAEALQTAERSGDDVSLTWARAARGIILNRCDDRECAVGSELLLAKASQKALRHRDLLTVTMVDIQIADHKAQIGDIDIAIEMCRATVNALFDTGKMIFRAPATTVLTESLLRRGTELDLQVAQAAVDRLAECPTDPTFVLNKLPVLRLRALLAKAHGDESAYRDYRDRYRALATSLGFEGHMKLAEPMP